MRRAGFFFFASFASCVPATPPVEPPGLVLVLDDTRLFASCLFAPSGCLSNDGDENTCDFGCIETLAVDGAAEDVGESVIVGEGGGDVVVSGCGSEAVVSVVPQEPVAIRPLRLLLVEGEPRLELTADADLFTTCGGDLFGGSCCTHDAPPLLRLARYGIGNDGESLLALRVLDRVDDAALGSLVALQIAGRLERRIGPVDVVDVGQPVRTEEAQVNGARVDMEAQRGPGNVVGLFWADGNVVAVEGGVDVTLLGATTHVDGGAITGALVAGAAEGSVVSFSGGGVDVEAVFFFVER